MQRLRLKGVLSHIVDHKYLLRHYGCGRVNNDKNVDSEINKKELLSSLDLTVFMA